MHSATGTRTRVARVRAEYPNQLDYSGVGDPPPWALASGTRGNPTSARPAPDRTVRRDTCQARQGHEGQQSVNGARKCISRESNPGHIDGNDVFYH